MQPPDLIRVKWMGRVVEVVYILRFSQERSMSVLCRNISAAILIGSLGLSVLSGCDSRSPAGGAATKTVAASTSTPARAETAPAPAQPANPAPKAISGSEPSVVTPTAPAQPPPIVVEPAVIEMGYLSAGVTKLGKAKLRNTGSVPIVVTRVQPNCTCTTVGDLAGTVIMPGEAAEVTAKYVAPQDTGPKQAKVWAWFQGYEDPVTVPVVAEVTMAVRAVPGYLKMEETEKGVGEIRVESIDGKPFRVLATDGQPPVFLDGFKPGDEPRSSYVLKWDLRRYMNPCRNMPWWWMVETDHPDCPLLDVRVRNECAMAGGFSINGREIFRHPKEQKWKLASPPARALAGAIPKGGSANVTIPTENLGAQKLITAVPLTANIRSVEITGSEFKNGEQIYTIKVTPAPTTTGLFFGIVQFTADDGGQSAAWIIGTVR